MILSVCMKGSLGRCCVCAIAICVNTIVWVILNHVDSFR